MDFNKVMTWGGNIFLVLSMAIAGLLGADKLGVRLFPTGKDTGFQSKQVADTQGNKQLQLWLSEGDASCVVNLKIKNVQANDRFTARYEGYQHAPPPALVVDKTDDGWLHIHQDLEKGAPSPDARFNLYQHDRVVIENADAPKQPLEVADWEIWPKESGGYDTSWARWWRGFILFLFLVTLLGVVVQGLKSFKIIPDAGGADAAAATPTAPRDAAAAFIGYVQGVNPAETAQLQKLVYQLAIRKLTLTAACKVLSIPLAKGRKMFGVASGHFNPLIDAMKGFRI